MMGRRAPDDDDASGAGRPFDSGERLDDDARRRRDNRKLGGRLLVAVVFTSLATAGLVGCSLVQGGAAASSGASSVGVEDVIAQCAAAYQNAKTLQLCGVLDDRRPDSRRVEHIRWDYLKPSRCRLQIGMDVVIVDGGNWWTHDAATGSFQRHRPFTRTPLETATYLVAKGVPFLVPAILTRGQAALRPGASNGRDDWQLRGSAWHGGSPCYVLTRHEKAGDPSGTDRDLTLWIDQDSHLVRGWRITVPRRGAGERIIVACDYDTVVVDGPLPSDAFQLKPPSPLVGPPEEVSSD